MTAYYNENDPRLTSWLYELMAAGVIAVEGGYVNDPNDAGGATNQDDNTTINITVPEPASLAAGMMAMASVAGMIAVRRRF